MKKIFFLLCVVLLLWVPYSSAETVKITTLEWNPYTGKHLPNKGFTSEIIQKAFKEAGLDSTIDFLPWDQTMAQVKKGTYDAFFSAYYTQARAKTYYFSDPYAESLLLLFTRKGNKIQFNSIKDLAGYTIGVTKGFANTPEFDRADFFTKVKFNTEQESLAGLIQKKVDLVVMDRYICLDLINRFFSKYKDEIVPLGKPLDKKPLFLLFTKSKSSSERYVLAFNRGLKLIRDKGLYDLILQRHRFLPMNLIGVSTLEWPPYTGSDIKQKGFVSDLVVNIYKISGYDVEISFKPWARVLRETEVGLHDMAFPAYYSEERDRKFILKSLDIQSRVGFMKSKALKIHTYKTLEDLKGYRIGVVLGYVNRPDFDKADFLLKKKGYSDRENIRDLIAGKLDLIVIDRLTAAHLMRQMGGHFQWEFLEPYLDMKNLYVAFSKRIPDLKRKMLAFEYGFEEIKAAGQFDRIKAKWMAAE